MNFCLLQIRVTFEKLNNSNHQVNKKEQKIFLRSKFNSSILSREQTQIKIKFLAKIFKKLDLIEQI